MKGVSVRLARDAVERLGEMQQNGYLDGSTPFENAVDEAVIGDDGKRVLFGLKTHLEVTVGEEVAAEFLSVLYNDVWEEGRTIDTLREPIMEASARAHANLHASELSSKFHEEYEDEPLLVDAIDGSDTLEEIYILLLDESGASKSRVVRQLQIQFDFSENLSKRVVSSWTRTSSDKMSTSTTVERPKAPSGADMVHERWRELTS